jgi:riboflavin transporter FmnP
LVFGFVVLLSGDAAVFMAIDPLGTILVVLVKGSLAGFSAGAIYKVMEKTNKTKAALSAAAVCPIVNTAVFIIGTYAFFLPTITEWAAAAGFASATAFIFIGMIGLNFIVELILNFVLSPVIIRLVQFGRDRAANAG